jgi:hypothetical protein
MSARFQAVLLAGVGLMYAFIVSFLAMGLSGGGHGWNSAGGSVLGLFALPLFGVAFAYRKHRLGRVLIQLVIVAAMAIDAAITWFAWGEGSYYLQRVLSSTEGRAIWFVWLALWLGWQISLVVVGLRSLKRDSPPSPVHGACPRGGLGPPLDGG